MGNWFDQGMAYGAAQSVRRVLLSWTGTAKAVQRLRQAKRKIVVSASQSSGSTMLCSALASTGVAGAPYEHFNEWMGGRLNFAQAVDAGFRDGVFGVKMMANYLPEASIRLARETGIGTPSTIFLDLMGPDAVWLHLERRDKRRHAISRFTKRMGLRAGIEKFDHDAKSRQVVFDYFLIRNIIEGEFDLEALFWKAYFSANGIRPVLLFYEELLADKELLPRTLTALGLAPAGPPRATTRMESGVFNELLELLYGFVNERVEATLTAAPDVQHLRTELSGMLAARPFSDRLGHDIVERNAESALRNLCDYPLRRFDDTKTVPFFPASFFDGLRSLYRRQTEP